MSGSFFNQPSVLGMPYQTASVTGQQPEAIMPDAAERLAPNMNPSGAPATGLAPFDGTGSVFGGSQSPQNPTQPQPQLPLGFQPFTGQPATYAGGGVIELQEGGKIAVGPGGGLDDLIPTTIDGQRAAALSDGEFVIPADVVSMMGDGSTRAGSQRLYDMVKQIRSAKTGTDEQAQPLQFADILRRLT